VAATAQALATGELTAAQASREITAAIELSLPDKTQLRPTFSARVDRTRAALAAGRATLLDDGRILLIGRGARTEHASAGASVSLDDHQQAVEAHAVETLATLGLPENLGHSVRRAARHHDEGKRDPRFQAWLRGGRTVDVEALAKSVYPYDPGRIRRLRLTTATTARSSGRRRRRRGRRCRAD
jgi:hypothetical protein